MGMELRSNCCNARIRIDKGKTFCLKCDCQRDPAAVHEVMVKSTVKVTLQKKK